MTHSEDERYRERIKEFLKKEGYQCSSEGAVDRTIRTLTFIPEEVDVETVLSHQRALDVKRLRIDGHTFRSLAAECGHLWGINVGSDQITGMRLVMLSGEMLGEDSESW